MHLKALLTSLAVLGSSSAALAHPTRHFPSEHHQAVVVERDRHHHHRIDRRFDAERPWRRDDRVHTPRGSWQALSPRLHLEPGAQIIEISSGARFAQLRLQNQTGRTRVDRVVVEFANGEQQAVDCDRRLEGNHAMLELALDGRARRIDRVVVYGRSSPGASYQLYAM